VPLDRPVTRDDAPAVHQPPQGAADRCARGRRGARATRPRHRGAGSRIQSEAERAASAADDLRGLLEAFDLTDGGTHDDLRVLRMQADRAAEEADATFEALTAEKNRLEGTLADKAHERRGGELRLEEAGLAEQLHEAADRYLVLAVASQLLDSAQSRTSANGSRTSSTRGARLQANHGLRVRRAHDPARGRAHRGLRPQGRGQDLRHPVARDRRAALPVPAARAHRTTRRGRKRAARTHGRRSRELRPGPQAGRRGKRSPNWRSRARWSSSRVIPRRSRSSIQSRRATRVSSWGAAGHSYLRGTRILKTPPRDASCYSRMQAAAS